jgi:hypothetical protein
MSEKELFENDAVELEVEEPIEEVKEEVEPVEEVEPEPEPEPTPEPEKPAKKPRKKRELTEAQKERLRENLKRGRETSLANRKKKAKLKQIEKEEKISIDDEKIFQSLKKKMGAADLENENAKLRAELFELRKEKEKRAEKKKVTIKEPEPEPEMEEVAPEPVKPIKIVKKPMTARQKMKMLRGL